MLLLRAVHMSSAFEFGAVFHDCLREDPQGNPPFSSFSGATWMNCVVIHMSSIFEFGVVFHDCLREDPQGNPPFSPFFGATWMLLLRAVHVFSNFEFGVEFHDCLREDPQGNPPFSPFSGATWMLLLRAIHVSSTFEFGAEFHDCLSADPQGNPPYSTFVPEPHECYCLEFFMCPPLSSAKSLVTGKHVILLFSGSVPSSNMCMCIFVYYVRCSLLLFVFCFLQKKKEGVEMRVVITERAERTKSVSYLCFPLISDER